MGCSQYFEVKNINRKNKLPLLKKTEIIDKLILNSSEENDIVLDYLWVVEVQQFHV